MAPAGLLGRTDELAVIGEVIGAFPDGDRALVLAGEAGIGKTVLWEAAEREARARGDLTVLTSRSSETEAGLAYVALTDLVAPIASSLLSTLPQPQAEALAAALLLDAPRLDGAGPTTRAMADPRTVGTAVLGILRAAAAEHPVVLAIDDLQWIDPASAAALEFALRRATDLPVGLLVTVRTPTAAGSGARIVTALGARTRTLDVGPISLGVLHHLVRDRAGASLTRPQLVRLEAASRGNPLLAIEMARELARLDQWPIVGEPLPVPADIAGLLGDRIGRLSELERDALFVAAAITSPTSESIRTAFDTTGIGATHRVCAYDRAGLGDSPPATESSRTSKDIVADLHALLTAAKLAGPYVLVGHSMAAWPVSLYVSEYPDDVVGVILVDPRGPKVSDGWRAALPAPAPSASEDPAVAANRDELSTFEFDPSKNMEHINLAESMAEASAVLDAEGPLFGDRPLVVLGAANTRTSWADLPADLVPAFDKVWLDGQKAFAAESTAGSFVSVPDSNHEIQFDQPAVVVQTIEDMFAALGS